MAEPTMDEELEGNVGAKDGRRDSIVTTPTLLFGRFIVIPRPFPLPAFIFPPPPRPLRVPIDPFGSRGINSGFGNNQGIDNTGKKDNLSHVWSSLIVTPPLTRTIFVVDDSGFNNQGIGNQGISNQGIGNQGIDNRGIDNQGIGNQGIGNTGIGNTGKKDNPSHVLRSLNVRPPLTRTIFFVEDSGINNSGINNSGIGQTGIGP
jgi:hypothetical protein